MKPQNKSSSKKVAANKIITNTENLTNPTEVERTALLEILRTRFEKNMPCHKDLNWNNIQSKLIANPQKLDTLHKMEKTGGEPDVVGYISDTNEFIFIDCCAETPLGRRNLCYDRKALDDRKEFKPNNSAIDLASKMGIEILTEQEYRELQKLRAFDTKTSSWIKTPNDVRVLGGALFADRRYNQVFIYHNGASSYYASRGFRGVLKV